MHTSVLLHEVLEYLNPQPGEFMVDGTVNGGGHAQAVLGRLGSKGKLLAVDWDCTLLTKFEAEHKDRKVRIVSECGNYAELPEIFKKRKLKKADGLLLDLGFSSLQLESSHRGFSFKGEEPLDMRYNLENPVSAYDVINKKSEKELTDIFWKLGEERYARSIARYLVEARRAKPIRTTAHLVEAIKAAVPARYMRGRIHPATRVFQALRIYVNSELENLERALQNLPALLASGGRAVIITFHSLEDRIVKHRFRELAKKGIGEVLTKKPIVPTDKEIQTNLRARSAKLRALKIL